MSETLQNAVGEAGFHVDHSGNNWKADPRGSEYGLFIATVLHNTIELRHTGEAWTVFFQSVNDFLGFTSRHCGQRVQRFTVKKDGRYWSGGQGFLAMTVGACYTYSLEKARRLQELKGGQIVEVLCVPTKPGQLGVYVEGQVGL